MTPFMTFISAGTTSLCPDQHNVVVRLMFLALTMSIPERTI
jgi:hypothetical protein